MNYNAYEILGLPTSATKEEATQRYNQLRQQFLQDRFLPGEEGELACERLQELDVAYRDVLDNIDEQNNATKDFDNATSSTDTTNTTADNNDSEYVEIQNLIKENRLDEAQEILDKKINRNAEWHYTQSILFYKRSWFLESKKQLEMACQIEPDNQRYKQSLEKLTKILASNTISPDQMRTTSRPMDEGFGGYGNGTCTGSSCGDCLLCNACCNCASCMSSGC